MRIRAIVPVLLALSALPVGASHDPLRTATIYVPGFNAHGASHVGVYGDDRHDDLLDDIAGLVGFPTTNQPGAAQPNIVASTSYYGDTPPAHYTPADLADVDAVTSTWGGGVPRYALVVAKYARHIMDRSGADQVNFVSGSFGSLVVRWLIEKDVEGLASGGEIARWLSLEGLVAGSWAASNDQLVRLWETFEVLPVDVDHMKYGWIDANLHSPRTEADHALYANILLGQEVSTDDAPNSRALTNAMIAFGDFQANDGIQGLDDARFHTITPQSRFLGEPPLRAFFDVDHYEVEDHPAAWAHVATFLVGRRRVTVTMTRAQVTNIHEPDDFLWDWTPAEVVFESRVYAPAVASTWGITDPMSARHRDGASTPIRGFGANGEQQTFTHVLFDDLVLDGETHLDLELWAEEIDWDLRYGVAEPLGGSYEDLGGGTINVPIAGPGTYAFAAGDWNCDITVAVVEYPFASVTDVSPAAALAVETLQVFPNPSYGRVRIAAPGAAATGTLSILDVRGSLVRRLAGDAGSGLVWDGRDDRGRRVAGGTYFVRLQARGETQTGKVVFLRE